MNDGKQTALTASAATMHIVESGLYRLDTRDPNPALRISKTFVELSKREREVLHWLSLGKSGGEIAMILAICVPTVRIHIRSILRKLSASNIPHAIARAFRMRIL